MLIEWLRGSEGAELKKEAKLLRLRLGYKLDSYSVKMNDREGK